MVIGAQSSTEMLQAPVIAPKIESQVQIKIGLCNYIEFGDKETVAAAFTTGDNSSGQLES